MFCVFSFKISSYKLKNIKLTFLFFINLFYFRLVVLNLLKPVHCKLLEYKLCTLNYRNIDFNINAVFLCFECNNKLGVKNCLFSLTIFCSRKSQTSFKKFNLLNIFYVHNIKKIMHTSVHTLKTNVIKNKVLLKALTT